MKLEEFQRLGQTVKTFTSKLHENPGKFVAIVTQMYWDMKAERDTLIDDLKVLREKNEKLEREKKREQAFTEQFKHDLQYAEWEIIPHLEQENEKLEEEKDDILLEREYYNNGYKDMIRRCKELESKHTTLTDHIRLKASANPGEHRYIALVNFIDRLERK